MPNSEVVQTARRLYQLESQRYEQQLKWDHGAYALVVLLLYCFAKILDLSYSFLAFSTLIDPHVFMVIG